MWEWPVFYQLCHTHSWLARRPSARMTSSWMSPPSSTLSSCPLYVSCWWPAYLCYGTFLFFTPFACPCCSSRRSPERPLRRASTVVRFDISHPWKDAYSPSWPNRLVLIIIWITPNVPWITPNVPWIGLNSPWIGLIIIIICRSRAYLCGPGASAG